MPSRIFKATFVVGALAPGEYVDASLPNFGLMVQPSGRRFCTKLPNRSVASAVVMHFARCVT